MSQKLISHNQDLQRLYDEGYEIQIKGGFILLHHVPYLNASRELKFGTLASAFNLAGDVTVSPQDHTAYFCGEHPCKLQGQPISGLVNSAVSNQLCEGIIAQFYLSSKPPQGYYANFYDKFTTYIHIISSYAKELYSECTAQTYLRLSSEDNPIFNYEDTNTSRASIFAVSNKLSSQKVAIIGLGGTGSYILDFVSKTPVSEIHIYDDDTFFTHNAFRSPGAPSTEELRKCKTKVEYLESIYSNMRKNIFAHKTKVIEENVNELLAYDFVFVSIDKGSARKTILNFLTRNSRHFIDVGIDVKVVDDSLIGQVRTTLGKPDHYDHLGKYVSYGDSENEEYQSNIQIAELNALNAVQAVIKWKQICGFYKDLYENVNSNYSIFNGGLSYAYKES